MRKNLIFKLKKKIKQKKEFGGLADKVILRELEDYFNKHKLCAVFISEHDEKVIVKEIRARLRRYSGMFQNNLKLREKAFKEGDMIELLKTHKSTKERLETYDKLREMIKKIKPKSILDIGCGLNPLILAGRGIAYYALDIKADELDLIDRFFKKKGINGKTIIFDICDIGKHSLPEADLCLLLKVLDIAKYQKRDLPEKIFDSVRCKYFLISFATKTLSGKQMARPEREWLERILLKRKFKFEKVKTRNEIFYLVEKEFTMKIRKCTIVDTQILKELFSVLYKPEMKWNERNIYEDIQSGKKTYYLALKKNEAVGAFGIKFSNSDAKFGPLAVKRAYQGKGVGSELLRFAEKLTKKRGLIRIWCHSLERYNAANFYQKNCWKEEDFIRDFLDRQNCFIYAKRI
jgi:GNAT superfamily N-acetyltransferase